MQFSETVVAAMIGAVATMSTAIFQLYSALRSRGKFDVRPNKRGITFRSIVSIVALMIASGAGGYIYAELKQQSAAEDLHSMRAELNAKLQLLATTTEKLAARESGTSPQLAANKTEAAAADSVAESVLYAPACQAGAACSESNSQRLTLCGQMPAAMQIRKVELFAKAAVAQATWDQSVANFEQDVGGAKFTGAPVEHAQDAAHKAVCVDFIHWSTEPHLARMVLQYGASAASSDAGQPQTAATATQTALPAAHIASMTSAAP
jgi:hypothetical protein